ncbi:MAG: 50S ribosomal protein L4 [Candidatus Parcubacteria bacterium]|nr:MAG: 50S ribosomal protein L4 [Candidatus Parcubacteria bacterium]
MNLKVYNQQGQEIDEIEVNGIFDSLKFNPDLVHQVMRWQILNNYYPWAHTKTRAEVSGGGRKPWRQKGTGRARHGSIRSPIWRGGGISFGPRKDKIRAIRINKKMKRKAILMVLAEKMRRDYVKVLDTLIPSKFKTKIMDKILSNFLEKRRTKKKRESALIVIPDNNKDLIRSIRNLSYADAIEARNLNILSLLNHKYIFLEPKSLEVIKETFIK